MKSLVELLKHLLVTMNVDFVLTGKFQTDDLESRFGHYRQMSGENGQFLFYSITSTDVKGAAQLAILIKAVDKELNETEELLSLQCMKDTTTVANIFSEVLNAFDKFGLDPSSLCGIATDGARDMSGTNIEFVGLLKSALKEKNISDNLAINYFCPRFFFFVQKIAGSKDMIKKVQCFLDLFHLFLFNNIRNACNVLRNCSIFINGNQLIKIITFKIEAHCFLRFYHGQVISVSGYVMQNASRLGGFINALFW